MAKARAKSPKQKPAKQPARKPAKQPAKASTSAAPFPFLGQGDAGYYEWFEMYVWFEQPVAPKERKPLLKGAPKLCTMDAQWPHATLLWASTGDQWIQQHLVEEYGTKAAKSKFAKATAKQGSDDYDDDDLDDTIASGGEQEAFNADIERWLRELHARRPILFAARREDGEAGGTKLGAWHKQSVTMFRDRVVPVLEALAKGPGLKPNDMRRSPIGIALEYVGEKSVKPAVRALGKDDDDDDDDDGDY